MTDVRLRTALRELTADGTVTQLRVTPRQDLLLFGIAPERVGEVEDRLRAHGVQLAGDVSALRRLAIACPALPTCGQALGEAERVLPDLVAELEKVFADSGAGDAEVRVNMTGCPNGCARPYTAEIGIVGRTKTTYDVYVGGSPTGERLAERIRADVPLDQIAAVLAPVLARYAEAGAASFGDWTDSVGAGTVATWLPEPVVRRRRAVGRGGVMTTPDPAIWAGIVPPAGEDPAQMPGWRDPRPDWGTRVWLVGAGPGDPELLTVKAARVLAGADVVVHDALVGDGVLDLVPASAERIDVGKRPGRPVPQELISALLVQLARDGRARRAAEGRRPLRVRARRRGGPGPARRRRPVRGRAGDHVGGRRPGRSRRAGDAPRRRPPPSPWSPGTAGPASRTSTGARSAKVGGTVVVLMGVAQRATIAAELIAGGLDPATPVAAVRSATTADEVVARCRLDELATTADRLAGRARDRRRRRPRPARPCARSCIWIGRQERPIQVQNLRRAVSRSPACGGPRTPCARRSSGRRRACSASPRRTGGVTPRTASGSATTR